jgi:hypothetical protein
MTEPLGAAAPAPSRPRPNTFSPIKLDPQELAALSFDEFVKVLVEKLTGFKGQRAAFYEGLRRRNAMWANGARAVLAILGAIALLLTSLAAAIRLAPDTFNVIKGAEPDRPILVGILVIYAVMGAISFYEKGSDKTSSYFRQIATILVIRDLWTRFQFELAKELMSLKGAVDPAVTEPSRLRILSLGQAFCVDLDKAATGELGEFRTEFMASLAEMDEAARKGTDQVTKLLDDRLKEAEKAAAEAKAAAEKAVVEAEKARAAAEAAGKPGFVNLSVTGEFDDEVVVLVGGTEVARSRGKLIALGPRPPGPTTLVLRAKKGTKELETSATVEVKPGIQEVKLALT